MGFNIIKGYGMNGCGKHLKLIMKDCGDWSLKHNETYLCCDCYQEQEARRE